MSALKPVLIVGLDTFAAKNAVQIRAMNPCGYSYHVLTNDRRGSSKRVFEQLAKEGNELHLLNGGFWSKMSTIYRVASNQAFNHAELYAAGKMSMFYCFALKLLKIPICLVERGDIGILSEMDGATRLSYEISYKLSNNVWFKEPYMETAIRKRVRSIPTFIPNAVEVQEEQASEGREIDFIWANRFIAQRRSDWLIRALRDERLNNATAVFLGLFKKPGPSVSDRQCYAQDNAPAGVELHDFCDPRPYFRKSRFFVLPSTIVFGNFSLLESMSYGVVPLVSSTNDTSKVINHMQNGIVFDHSEEGLVSGLIEALEMSEAQWIDLSEAAKATVVEKFGIKNFSSKLEKLYTSMSASETRSRA